MDSADPLPVYACRRIEQDFVPDGDLFRYPWTEVEPVWFLPATLETGSFIEDLRDSLGGERLGFAEVTPASAALFATDFQPTAFAACWSDTRLYLAWQCFDTDIWSEYTRRDDPLYEQEVVEAFLCPTGDLCHYFELNISPANLIFDAKVHSPDLRRGTMNVDVAWDAAGLQTAVRVEGSLNNRNDVDRRWSVEAAVSYSALSVDVPRPGDEWRANFYRIDRKEPLEFTSWSPTRETPANFHVPERFGRFKFR